MKKIYFFALTALFTLPSTLQAQTAYINEFHYDNAGVDANEFVEVAVQTGYTCGDPAGLQIVLYNGSNVNAAVTYATYSLPATGTSVSGGTLFVVNTPGIQNGSNDGIALICGTNVLQLLSYEGAFTASNGPAIGLTSVDVGVSEPGNGSTTGSIFFSGGVWQVDSSTSSATPGALNPAQITLPVTLKFFQASITPNGHQLVWETANEEDVRNYIVQWSADGRTFSDRESFSGNKADGNYSYLDKNFVIGENFYRLKIEHFGSATEYSKILKIVDKNTNPNASLRVLENPVQGNNLRFAVGGFGSTPSIAIIDAIGKVYAYTLSAQGEQKLDISNLAPGTYFLKASDAGAVKIVRFVK